LPAEAHAFGSIPAGSYPAGSSWEFSSLDGC
jgi:hypothetical protein